MDYFRKCNEISGMRAYDSPCPVVGRCERVIGKVS